MKKYISPRTLLIDLEEETELLLIISVDPDENVDDDDKTRRRNFTIWDQVDMDY